MKLEDRLAWIVCGCGLAVIIGNVLTGMMTWKLCLSGLIGGAARLAFGLIYQRLWGKNKTDKN